VNSPDIASAADNVIADVERCYETSLDAVDGTIFGLGSDDAELKQVRDARPKIDDWERTLRTFAERGYKDDGRPYSWAEWANYGAELIADLTYIAGCAADEGLIAVLLRTADATARTVEDAGSAVANVANIGAWGTGTKMIAALGLGLLLVVRLRK
jgi:hypothetical protein